MYSYGRKSQERFDQCHPLLQVILSKVITMVDHSITCAYRGEAEQMAAYNAVPKLSHAKFGESAHNFTPSMAVDIVPWPIDWEDMERFGYLAGLMKGVALEMEIPLTWGNDWNNNGVLVRNDPKERLIDAPHFELRNWKELI